MKIIITMFVMVIIITQGSIYGLALNTEMRKTETEIEKALVLRKFNKWKNEKWFKSIQKYIETIWETEAIDTKGFFPEILKYITLKSHYKVPVNSEKTQKIYNIITKIQKLIIFTEQWGGMHFDFFWQSISDNQHKQDLILMIELSVIANKFKNADFTITWLNKILIQPLGLDKNDLISLRQELETLIIQRGKLPSKKWFKEILMRASNEIKLNTQDFFTKESRFLDDFIEMLYMCA